MRYELVPHQLEQEAGDPHLSASQSHDLEGHPSAFVDHLEACAFLPFVLIWSPQSHQEIDRPQVDASSSVVASTCVVLRSTVTASGRAFATNTSVGSSDIAMCPQISPHLGCHRPSGVKFTQRLLRREFFLGELQGGSPQSSESGLSFVIDVVSGISSHLRLLFSS